MDKKKFQNDTSIDKEEKLGDAKAVSPAIVDATESTSVTAAKGTNSDPVADAIDKSFGKSNMQNSKPSSSNKPFDKKRPGSNRKNQNKSTHEGTPTSGSSNANTRSGGSNTVNTPSSSVTKTKVNDFIDFSESLSPQYETTGWRQLSDERAIFQKLNDAFADSGVLGAKTIDHRGDLNRNFRQWMQILKHRPLNTNHAYVIDHVKSDKSQATEKMVDRFYMSRRPYGKLANGVPLNNMTKAPDIMYNVKFLNVSTNYHTQHLPQMYRRAATYGILEQDLNSDVGYQSRSIGLVAGSTVNSLPSNYIGYRYPSGNDNYLHTGQPVNPDNVLNSYSISLINNDRIIDGPVNMSLELMNKTKTIRKLFSRIQDEASKYAADAKSGDNSWFSPAFMIADEATLAATLNSPADLKTMLYIINDAINGAFRSQLMIASKFGTPDSTFIGLTSKNNAIKNQFDEAFSDIWSYFKPIPMHRDVIEKWNQYKHWSKFHDGNLYDADNMLQIPCFMLTRSGGGYYDNKSQLKEITGQVRPKEEHAHPDNLINALTYSGQTLDGAAIRLPHGDWWAFFVQNVFGKLAMESFIRVGKSNSLVCNTMKKDTLSGAADTQLNANKLKEKVLEIWTQQKLIDGTNLNVPKNEVRYIREAGAKEDALPETINGEEASKGNSNIFPTFSGDNVYFDMLISYHTVTAFMTAFMELIVSMSLNGHFDTWKRLLKITTPYFSRLATLSDSDDAFIFNDNIPVVSLSSMPSPFSEIPKVNSLDNLDFYYPKAAEYATAKMAWEPVRYNIVDTEWNNYSYAPYKVLGLRYSMINLDGKADRDIIADNVLATVLPSNNKGIRTIWKKSTDGLAGNTYMVSNTILRPNSYMACSFAGRILNTQEPLFPIYIGNHVGLMVDSVENFSANVFAVGGANISVAQLEHRPLMMNTYDDLVQSPYPGAFTQAVMSQLYYDYNNFLTRAGVPFTNGHFASTGWLNRGTLSALNSNRLIATYANNSSTNVIDEIFNLSYDRFNLSDSKCISTLKFNVI